MTSLTRTQKLKIICVANETGKDTDNLKKQLNRNIVSLRPFNSWNLFLYYEITVMNH